MSRIYKTAQGQLINMDKLQLENEKEIAVGNANTNARGDLIAKNGQIIKTRNELIKEYYNKRKEGK